MRPVERPEKGGVILPPEIEDKTLEAEKSYVEQKKKTVKTPASVPLRMAFENVFYAK